MWAVILGDGFEGDLRQAQGHPNLRLADGRFKQVTKHKMPIEIARNLSIILRRSLKKFAYLKARNIT